MVELRQDTVRKPQAIRRLFVLRSLPTTLRPLGCKPFRCSQASQPCPQQRLYVHFVMQSSVGLQEFTVKNRLKTRMVETTQAEITTLTASTVRRYAAAGSCRVRKDIPARWTLICIDVKQTQTTNSENSNGRAWSPGPGMCKHCGKEVTRTEPEQ